VPYDAARHRGGVHGVLAKNHWEGRYIAGQLDGLCSLSLAPASGTRGKVYVHEAEGRVSGFISVEFREWNRLGQLHGLAVDPDLKRRGIASVLVGRAEEFVQGEGSRGVYVDTTSSSSRSKKTTLYAQPYSPECVEEAFCELRLQGVLRSWRLSRYKSSKRIYVGVGDALRLVGRHHALRTGRSTR
jgi:GNAT superfamily N-acetyltransferase